MSIRIKSGILLCIITAFCLFAPFSACAEEAEHKTVRVGWYESPFNFTDQFGRRSGYAYDYQQKISACTSWEYEYVEGSRPELLEMLQNGEIDLLSDVSYTEERASKMLFSSLPMGDEIYYIYASDGNSELRPGDYMALDGKKVGVNKNSIQEQLCLDWEKKNGIHSNVIEISGSQETAVQMLTDGEIDALVTIDAYGESGIYIPIFKI